LETDTCEVHPKIGLGIKTLIKFFARGHEVHWGVRRRRRRRRREENGKKNWREQARDEGRREEEQQQMRDRQLSGEEGEEGEEGGIGREEGERRVSTHKHQGQAAG
jgi:hypothetical protein